MGRVLFHSNGIALLLGLILTLGGTSVAEARKFPKPLKGIYDFAASVTCAVDSVGFDDSINEFDREGGGLSVTLTVQGRVTYAGDSTGSFTGQVLVVNHDATGIGAFPIIQSTVNCTVANTLNLDGTFTETRTCTGTPTAGFRVNLDQTTSFPVHFKGVVGPRREILHYHDTELDEETVTDTDNSTGNVVATRTRICTRLGSAIKQ